MSHIFVFAASGMEARSVKSLMNPARRAPGSSGSITGRIGVNEVSLFVTGIGPQKAGASARAVLIPVDAPQSGSTSMKRRPDAVLVIGLCGSLTAVINEGDLVLYSNCLSAGSEQARQSCTIELTNRICSLLNSQRMTCRKVVGITSMRVASSKAEKLSLAASGAEIVDMESYPIVVAATQAGIPVAVIRVVSDSLDREMPDFNQALKADGKIDSLAMAKIFIGSPIVTSRLLAASQRSTWKLKGALRHTLESDQLIFSRLYPNQEGFH